MDVTKIRLNIIVRLIFGIIFQIPTELLDLIRKLSQGTMLVDTRGNCEDEVTSINMATGWYTNLYSKGFFFNQQEWTGTIKKMGGWNDKMIIFGKPPQNNYNINQMVNFSTNIIQNIECGENHLFLLTYQLVVYGAGCNKYGQISKDKKKYFRNFKQVNNGIIKIFAGGFHTIYETIKKKWIAIGKNDKNQLESNLNQLNLISFGLGMEHTVAWDAIGTIYVWGNYDYCPILESNHHEPLKILKIDKKKLNVISIQASCGWSHTGLFIRCKNKFDNHGYLFGDNQYNQIQYSSNNKFKQWTISKPLYSKITNDGWAYDGCWIETIIAIQNNTFHLLITDEK